MTRIFKKTFISLCLSGALAAAVSTAWAWGEADAGLPGAFLNYGAGARAIAMGRAFAGLADDASAIYFNPGGLNGIQENQLLLQYMTLLDSGSYSYLGYDHIFPYVGTLGLGVTYLSQGTAEGRNVEGDPTTSFTNSQLGILLGFGSDLAEQLSLGASLKIVNQNLMNYSETGFGVDAGLIYRPFSFLNIGLSFQNLLAPVIKLKTDAERYPLNMTAGFGFKFFDNHLLADVDVTKSMEQDTAKPRFGVEGEPVDDFFIRAGMDDTEIGLGLGYRFEGFQLDYAVGLQTVETMHKIALSYYFGGYVMEIKPTPSSFSPVGINKVCVFKISVLTKTPVVHWDIKIVNEANAMVKNYSGDGNPPDHVVWDGLMDNTNAMPKQQV